MPEYKQDQLAVMVGKTVVAFIIGLLVFYFVRLIIGFFGIIAVDADPLVYAFTMIVLPMAMAFIGIYRVIGAFL